MTPVSWRIAPAAAAIFTGAQRKGGVNVDK